MFFLPLFFKGVSALLRLGHVAVIVRHMAGIADVHLFALVFRGAHQLGLVPGMALMACKAAYPGAWHAAGQASHPLCGVPWDGPSLSRIKVNLGNLVVLGFSQFIGGLKWRELATPGTRLVTFQA